MVCSAAELPNLVTADRCPFLHVISYGEVHAELRARCAASGFQLWLLEDLEQAGRAALPLLKQLQARRGGTGR